MPQLGESVVEGTVSRWLKQPGDPVAEYEALVEVSTDKVDTEIPSPAAGVILEILVEAGQVVAVGTLLAVIGETGDDDGPDQPMTHINGKEHKGVSTSGHVTPVVARMVAEHNLDLGQITGTGRAGRVTKKDVLAYLTTLETDADVPAWEQPVEDVDLFNPTVVYGAEPDAIPTKVPSQTASEISLPADTPGELIEHSAMRRRIAKHMVQSKLQTAPHVTTVFEFDMHAVMQHRAAHHDAYAKQGVNLTLTAYFVQATVAALQAHPRLNSQWTDEGLLLHQAQHIGVAVALDDGLIVPVIRNAQDLNLLGLARTVNDVARRARAGQLQLHEMQGGTFTISNHGVSGSLLATPIIHQPQAAILGVGKVDQRVKVIDDAIAIRPQCYVSLTFDHRALDGAQADAFMRALQSALENWA